MISFARKPARAATLAAGAAIATGPASSHEVAGGHGAFAAGFAHLFTGIDHVLVTVGALATMRGGGSASALPGVFLAAMIAGKLVALAGAPVLFAEQMIMSSLLAVGCLASAAAKLGTGAMVSVAAAFAFFHGAAHGFEASAGAGPAGYVFEFTAGAAVLLVIGHATAHCAARFSLRSRSG
jgi:urease accessory protein